MSQTKLFFSYSRTDAEFALELAKRLRERGIDLWIDQLDIETGEAWDRAVEGALERCSGVIVILSPTSVASTNVMDEVAYALEEGKHLFPVIFQECKAPLRLRRLQHTDLSVDFEAGFDRLVEDLHQRAALSASHQPESPADRPKSAAVTPAPPAAPAAIEARRRPILLIAMAALVAVALATFAYRSLKSKRGRAHEPARPVATKSVIAGIELPAFVVLDSAFKEKRQAQRRMVELAHEGFENSGHFWIPDFEYLSGAELFQVYIGPFARKEQAEAAVCRHNRKNSSTTYAVLLSDKPGRREVRCPSS